MPPEQSSEHPRSEKSSSPLLAVVAVLVIAVLAFFGYRVMKKPTEEMAADTIPSTQAAPTNPVPTEPAPAGTMLADQKFLDGTYTATGSYAIPNGKTEEMTVTLTLAGDIVTDVNYTSVPLEKGSAVNQAKFSSGYKTEVVGKNIDEIDLTVVNGSSLTPVGFMNALAKIKAEAAPSAPEAM